MADAGLKGDAKPIKYQRLVFAGMLVLADIDIFSTYQFGSIPKSMGGGMPETAYLKFSQSNTDIPISLAIPLASTNGLYGPISLLLHDDKELTFLDYAELNHALFVTNLVLAVTTTNVFGSKISIKFPAHYQTFLYVQHLIAKQVQADLVQAIVFGNPSDIK